MSNIPTTLPLNPVILVPDLNLDWPLQDCLDILSHFQGIRPDVKDVPLPRAEIKWFKDCSNFNVLIWDAFDESFDAFDT